MALARQEGVDWGSANDFWNQGAAEAGETTEVEQEAQESTEDAEEGDGLVEVRIRGRAIRMSAEDAAAYEEQLREFRERDGRLGGELSQLRERSARLEGALSSLQAGNTRQEPELVPPSPKLAIDDFEEYHRQMLSYNQAMVQQQRADLERRYEEAETMRGRQAEEASRNTSWAQRFYTENEHLDRPELKGMVSEVYSQHQAEIDALGEARDEEGRLLSHARLAELAEQRLLTIARATRTDNIQRPPRIEGAGRGRGTARTTSQPVKPMTGEEWMRRKRSQMRGEK